MEVLKTSIGLSMKTEARKVQRPVRVFLLIKSLGRGGAEILLAETLQESARDRFVYGYGYLLPDKNALVPTLMRSGADVICFGAKRPLGWLAAVPAIARFLRKWSADMVHCHLPVAGVIGRLAGLLANVPVVYTEHCVMERYHPWTQRANVWTWNLQDRIVAVSQDVAKSIHMHAG